VLVSQSCPLSPRYHPCIALTMGPSAPLSFKPPPCCFTEFSHHFTSQCLHAEFLLHARGSRQQIGCPGSPGQDSSSLWSMKKNKCFLSKSRRRIPTLDHLSAFFPGSDSREWCPSGLCSEPTASPPHKGLSGCTDVSWPGFVVLRLCLLDLSGCGRGADQSGMQMTVM